MKQTTSIPVFFILSCTLLILVNQTLSIVIPKQYDIRDKYPLCSNILNQGNCGSCWSFSATQGLSDRFCIATNKTLILSPQYNINCEQDDQAGCGGGSTVQAYEWFSTSGVDKLSCTSYYSGETGDTGNCPSSCDKDSQESLELFYSKKGYSLKANTIKDTVENIQKDVLEYGPVSVSFLVYTDFVPFFAQNPTGVYSFRGGTLRGGHAVKVVGWGTTAEGMDYWIIANSWGTKFADKGYFRIRRGTDECTIESRLISAGIPNTNRRMNLANGHHIPPYAAPFSVKDKSIIDGGFHEIPIDEEVYQVFEHVLSDQQVKRDRVIGVTKAFSQVTNGINFKLDIAMASTNDRMNANGSQSSVTVIVNRQHDSKMQILSIH
jgi:cathepsin B